MIDFFTKATSPLTITFIIALVVLLFVNRSLSSDLDKERAEKAKALVTISILEQRIISISKMKKADNQAAKDIFDHMELYNELNTSTATNIANAPSLLGQTPLSVASRESTSASSERQSKEPLSCNRKGQTSCNIDVPLPSLSVPLILLYQNLSNATGGSAPLAYGNKTSAHSASKGDDRPTAGTVGKGTSRHSR